MQTHVDRACQRDNDNQQLVVESKSHGISMYGRAKQIDRAMNVSLGPPCKNHVPCEIVIRICTNDVLLVTATVVCLMSDLHYFVQVVDYTWHRIQQLGTL